ncbi:hypothetical protein BKA70DRAFT_1132083 [Coprinopsis sp. MPI-PUGE-AT-0042]|nr:hypothetical protein BKA70DRAFT_1132083 [Coprinopsis sp. MPI-PUGE-AT-0042]
MAARLDVVVAKTASEVKARPTYGGFDGVEGLHIITFEDWRAELRANPPDVRFARDIPTAAADRANLSLSRGEAVHGLLELFQAYIQEHTQDEPDAPPVEIINDIDPELEPIPPWEFHYSNMMWHSAEVPIPDLSEGSLGACDCRGRCDPKSKTCSCVKRQHEWRAKLGYEGPQFNDFRYGANGKIKDSETLLQYPIFECNALCGCDADCRNRVVQNGRRVAVSIKKTKGKGWGVFAGPKKIPKGQFLGIYSGELLSSDESQRRGEVYNKTGRTYLFDLDFHHLNVGEDPEWEPLYTVDAYHAGNFTRFLNHSCDPNVLIHPCYVNEGNINKPLLTMFTSRDIAAYEEICFDYAGGSEFSEEQKKSMEEARKSGDAIYERCLCQAANCRGEFCDISWYDVRTDALATTCRFYVLTAIISS